VGEMIQEGKSLVCSWGKTSKARTILGRNLGSDKYGSQCKLVVNQSETVRIKGVFELLV
jgi:hypothetical protein